MASLATSPPVEAPRLGDVHHAVQRHAGEVGQDDVVDDAVLAAEAVAPILRDEPEAERDGIARAADIGLRAADEDLAAPRPLARRRTSP